jgi:hypothetical protein
MVLWQPVKETKLYEVRAVSVLPGEDQLLAISFTLETKATLPVVPIQGED